MNNHLRWVLPIPILLFCCASWLVVRTENEVLMQMSRAERAWRAEDSRTALALYQAIVEKYPKSRYADQALWELGMIHQIDRNDASAAIEFFTRLVQEYPSSPRVVEAYLKLAEIYEAELMDFATSGTYLSQALSLEARPAPRREILFRIANSHFKSNQFHLALEHFRSLLDGTGDDLEDQSRLRIAAILQIQGRYEEAAATFLEVIKNTDCLECRRAARLGLIESYEFVGDLPRAIELAQAIPPSEYSAREKQDLLRRLEEKEKYYDPSASRP